MTTSIRSARAFLAALDAAGVTISAGSRTVLLARPTQRVDAALAVQLKAFKVELLGVFSRAGSDSRGCGIVACERCDLEFATVPAVLCPWCKVTEMSSITPDSYTEIRHLASDLNPRATVPNCPHVDNRESGDSGDSWGQNSSKTHTRARANRITQNTVPTVPSAQTVPTLFDAEAQS